MALGDPWYIEQLRKFVQTPAILGDTQALRPREKAAMDLLNWDMQQRALQPRSIWAGHAQSGSGQSGGQPLPTKSVVHSAPGGPSQQQTAAGFDPLLSAFWQPRPPAAATPTVQTSITPQPNYTPDMTRYAANQAVAEAHRAASLPGLLAQAARPGMASTSPATIASVLPQVGQAQAQAAAAPANIALADAIANARNILSGEVAREQEAQGLAGLDLAQQAMLRNYQLGNLRTLSSLLSGLLG